VPAMAGGNGGPSQTLWSILVHLGPLTLLTLPGLLLLRRWPMLNLLIGVLVGFALLAFLVPFPARWWSVVAPLACVLTVWMWRAVGDFPRPARLLASCALGSLLLAGPLACCQRAASLLAVATGWQSREAFLLTREPTFRAAAVFNRIARAGDRLYCQDASTFYFACPAARDLRSLGQDSSAPEDRPAAERPASSGGAGCSYLLVAEPVEGDDQTRDSSAAATLPIGLEEDSARPRQVIPILEYRFADDNNRFIRYRLLRIR
jgi:hypothetical protein